MALQDGLAPSFRTHAGMLSSMTGCSALCWDAQLHTGMLGSVPGCSPLCWVLSSVLGCSALCRDARLYGGMLGSVLGCLAPCQDAWLYVGMLGSVLGCSALCWDAQIGTGMLSSVPGCSALCQEARNQLRGPGGCAWIPQLGRVPTPHGWDTSPNPVGHPGMTGWGMQLWPVPRSKQELQCSPFPGTQLRTI